MSRVKSNGVRFSGSTGGMLAACLNAVETQQMKPESAVYIEIQRDGKTGFLTLSLSQAQVLSDDLLRLIASYREQEPRELTREETVESLPVGTIFKTRQYKYVRTQDGALTLEGPRFVNEVRTLSAFALANDNNASDVTVLYNPDEA